MSREVIALSKPQQTILLSVKGTFELMGKHKEIDNLITLDWHMPASVSPPLYAVSIGKTKFSLGLLKQSRVFAVNFMGHEYEKQVLYCGQNSGVKVNKYKETGLTPVECEKIDCKYVKEASAVYECEVIDEVDAGDHILVIGKILQTHTFNDNKRLLHLGGTEFTRTMK